MKEDYSGVLIIKLNIKSLEDWRLLTNLERDGCSLVYVFLVCCHQHLRTRCTSINIFFTGSVITIGHIAVCTLSVAARNEDRVAHRTGSTFPQGEKAKNILYVCWRHKRSYSIRSWHENVTRGKVCLEILSACRRLERST
jgi:hypothetical protein